MEIARGEKYWQESNYRQHVSYIMTILSSLRSEIISWIRTKIKSTRICTTSYRNYSWWTEIGQSSLARTLSQFAIYKLQIVTNEPKITCTNLCQRPYHVECTASRPISEVKQRWVWLVLGWVTAWEHQMLLAFAAFLEKNYQSHHYKIYTYN